MHSFYCRIILVEVLLISLSCSQELTNTSLLADYKIKNNEKNNSSWKRDKDWKTWKKEKSWKAWKYPNSKGEIEQVDGMNTSSLQWPSLLPEQKFCGFQTVKPKWGIETGYGTTNQANPSFYVVGGTEAIRHSWPWLVRIVFPVKKQENNSFEYLPKCAGSILGKRWILTASHCFNLLDDILLFFKEFPKYPMVDPFFNMSRVKVLVGSHFTDEPVDPHERGIEIDKYFHYDNYRNRTEDLTLIRLKEDIDLDFSASPLCLNSNAKEGSHGCVIAGWGKVDKDGTEDSDVLMQARISLIKRNLCKQLYSKLGSEVHPSEICGGKRKGGVDACNGDSGSPLMCTDSQGRYFAYGIVKKGPSKKSADGEVKRVCALDNVPGIYTDVTQFSSWIWNTIKKNSS